MALLVVVPVAILLFCLALPLFLPWLGWTMRRDERRKRERVAAWPCGWCVAPLGVAALDRGDAVQAAWRVATPADDALVGRRHPHSLDACCPRCGAGHGYDGGTGGFVMVDAREVAALSGSPNAARGGVAMAWPWQPWLAASCRIVVGRHSGPPIVVAVPPSVDVGAIAEALLRLPDLDLAGGWRLTVGPVEIAFRRRDGMPAIRRSGPALRVEQLGSGDAVALERAEDLRA
ncbi:hypothetical protein ACFSGX_06645 [Sphingomonas arantia]|uniref:DUF2797 domain-containing protein n=1 Tax=Sphingomonas arantia TaxID=1460676 RepID=A0ABW4TV58_9SPHN